MVELSAQDAESNSPMKRRIEYIIDALVLMAIIAKIIAFLGSVLLGLLWCCAEFPSVTAWTITASLAALSVKSLLD